MHTFGDERHLSSLRVMLTLQTAPLVSALFIMVAMKCESCYLSAIRASAFFPLRHRLARHVSAEGGLSVVPFLRCHCENLSRGFITTRWWEKEKRATRGVCFPAPRTPGDKEKANVIASLVLPLKFLYWHVSLVTVTRLCGGPGRADGNRMSQCDSTMHNSRSEQQGGDTDPAEPPLFCLPRVTEFGSSSVPTQAIKVARSCPRPFQRASGSGLWLSDLVCVDASSQAAFLTIWSFSPTPPHATLPASSSSPSPWCLCCPGVPIGCSSGHEQTICQFARLRNMNHVRKLASAHDLVSTRSSPWEC